jgi:malonyl CoA-acyl carrier protein transacylase
LLGEYAALASVGNVLSVESLVELVFIRGITMQNAVPRDEQVKRYPLPIINTMNREDHVLAWLLLIHRELEYFSHLKI